MIFDVSIAFLKNISSKLGVKDLTMTASDHNIALHSREDRYQKTFQSIFKTSNNRLCLLLPCSDVTSALVLHRLFGVAAQYGGQEGHGQ